jgi:hypothetical protein
MWKLIITMTTPSKNPMAPGKPSPPHHICVVSLESLHCVYCKKTGHFCSKFCREKSVFECMIGGTLLALSFALQMSTTMATLAYGKDSLLF